jgi:hypothetical protein
MVNCRKTVRLISQYETRLNQVIFFYSSYLNKQSK